MTDPDKYILSNGYYFEVTFRGPQIKVTLFEEDGTKSPDARGRNDEFLTGFTPIQLMQSIISLTKEFFREDLDNPKRELWRGDIRIVEEIKAPEPTFIDVKGRVADEETQEGLSGVKVTLGTNNATTDSEGKYTVRVKVEEGEEFPTSLNFVKAGYSPKTNIPATTLNGDLKTSINVILLGKLVKSLEKEISGIQVIEEKDINSLKRIETKSVEAIVVEQVNKQTNNLYKRAIPFALGILARFGITKLEQLLVKSCPPITTIPEAIADKNKLTKQLNNSYRTITSVKNAGTIIAALTTAVTIVYQIFKKNPIPSTIGTPPGPAGGVIISQSLGKITSIDEKRERAKNIIDKLENVSKSFTPAIIPLGTALTKLIELLSGIDNMIGDCLDGVRQQVLDELNKKQQGDITGAVTGSNVGIGVGSNGENISGGGLNTNDARAAGVNTIDNFDFTTLSDEELKNLLGIDPNTDIDIQDLLSGNYVQVALDAELTALTEQAAQDGEPSVTEYNGFILSVETESEEAAQGKSIKRRFAVAKNKDGVTLLQGDKSYSSNDQILIDELIFKIEQENLTPN